MLVWLGQKLITEKKTVKREAVNANLNTWRKTALSVFSASYDPTDVTLLP